MKSVWQAYYYDGKTAERHDAELSISPESLSIKSGNETTVWNLNDTEQTQGFNEGEPVRLEQGNEALIIKEQGFIEALREMAPAHAARFRKPEKTRKSLYIIPAAALLTIGIGMAVYFWAIPQSVEFVAEKVPPSVEDRMGRSFVKGLTDVVPQCQSPELTDSAEKILARLKAAAPENPYDFRIYILDDPMVNAFASPGGHIVLFSGLIESTETPEELAGIMAHEMQHIIKRHSTQGLIQNLSTGLLLVAAFGDFGGLSNAAGTLGSLNYGRELEDEADRLGTELLVRSGTDPQGFIAFFDRLWECECKKKKEAGTADRVLSYLSTHPSTGDRIEKIKKHLEKTPRTKTIEPVLPEVDWKKVKYSCSGPAETDQHGALDSSTAATD